MAVPVMTVAMVMAVTVRMVMIVVIMVVVIVRVSGMIVRHGSYIPPRAGRINLRERFRRQWLRPGAKRR